MQKNQPLSSELFILQRIFAGQLSMEMDGKSISVRDKDEEWGKGYDFGHWLGDSSGSHYSPYPSWLVSQSGERESSSVLLWLTLQASHDKEVKERERERERGRRAFIRYSDAAATLLYTHIHYQWAQRQKFLS